MNTGAEEQNQANQAAKQQHKIKLVNTDNLKPHEHTDTKKLTEVIESIIKEGLRYPIIADMKTNIILDGHHRYNAFKSLNIKNIPVYYVNYLDETIILDSWGDTKLTKKEVIAKVESGEQFPIKTTKHMLLTEHGPVHISESLPKINLNIKIPAKN